MRALLLSRALPAPSHDRRIALLCLLLAGLGCRPDFPSAPDQQLVCLADADCPAGFVCPDGVGLCLDALSPCVAGGEALDDGAACGETEVCARGVCQQSACGDGVVDERSEICDGSPDCHEDCTRNICGDGVVLPAEEACDDGNAVGGDGCSADCQAVEVCGNAFVDEGEDCDDANDNPNDGCDGCAATRWESVVLTGRGASGGRPREVALLPFAAVPAMGLALRDGELFFAGVNQVLAMDEERETVRAVVGVAPGGASSDAPGALAGEIDSFIIGGLAFDRVGRLHFSDFDDSQLRVRRVEADGRLTTVAGGAGLLPGNNRGDGGPAAAARFSFISDLAFDALGRLYIADFGDHRVRRIRADGLIETFAGTDGGFGGDEGPAAEAQLFNPTSLVVDEDGSVYIADTGNHRVRVVDEAGVISTFVGGASADAGPPPEPAPREQADVEFPTGLALRQGRLCFSERLRHQVRCVEDGFVTRFAGSGVGGFAGDGGAAVDAALSEPRALLFEPDGALLIEDIGNNRLRRVDVEGNIDTVLGSGLRIDQPEGTSPLSFNVGFGHVAVSPTGELHFASTTQRLVMRVAADGTLRRVAGTGGAGSDGDGGDAQLANFRDIADITFDDEGRLLILDRGDSSLRRVEGGVITRLLSGDPGPGDCTDGLLRGPSGVDVDELGRVLIADTRNRCVRRWDEDTGELTRVAGNGATGQDLAGSVALDVPLDNVRDVASDGAGGFFIAESSSIGADAVVRHVDAAGVITVVAGGGSVAQDGVSPLDADLRGLERVATDASGEVYFNSIHVDSGGRLQRIAAGVTRTLAGRDEGDPGPPLLLLEGGPADQHLLGTITSFVVQPEIVFGSGAAVFHLDGSAALRTRAASLHPPTGDADRSSIPRPRTLEMVGPELFIANESPGHVARVQFNDAGPDRVELVAGARAGATLDVAPPPPFARVFQISGIAWDGEDRVFLGERGDLQGGGRVLVLTRASGPPAEWSLDVLTEDVSRPSALVFHDGALYLADEVRHQVLVVDVDTGAVSEHYGERDRPGAEPGRLFAPAALAVDPAGIVFVADLTHRVLALQGASVSVVVGTGFPSPLGAGAPASAIPIDSPRGLAFDRHGNLLLTSTRSLRLVVPHPDDGLVAGTGEVLEIFTGGEDGAFCLSDVVERLDGVVHVADDCTNLIFELERKP